MSEAETSAAPAVAAPRAQGPGRVLGVLVALAAFLGALAWIGKGLFAAPVDGAARRRRSTRAAAPPFGLALASAARLPGGEALVRFARPAEGAGPLDAVFLEPTGRKAAEALLAPTPEEFPGMSATRLKEWEKEKAFEWHMTRKRGDFAWGAWSTKLLVERSYEKGGGWSEEARVDLSSGERALVLLAHWPPGEAVDEAKLRELLSAVAIAPAGS